MSKSYKIRIADQLLARKLAGVGAVLVEGPKWCGKTTTCEQVAESILYMADPETHEQNLRAAQINIKDLLEGGRPRLIDEWQEVPKFWDAVRYAVDHSDADGQFILTGSAVPPDSDEIVHTGTGRIAKLRMRPMTLWESGESSGGVSFSSLFAGESLTTAPAKPWRLKDIAHLTCRGGWPRAVLQRPEISIDRAFEYYEAVVGSDISRVDKVPRDPERVKRLMRSYARLQGTQSNLSAIRKDMKEHDDRTLDEDTVGSYLKALRKIFVVEDVPAWSPCLRSKAVVRTSDTRYFSDPSIATAAMELGPGDLMNDLRSFGYFFETLVLRDLRTYAEANFGSISHYLDKNGLECDAVMRVRSGAYGLIEIKLGGEDLIEEAAKTLRSLAQIIDMDKMKEPSFRMVVTATGDLAYRRKDGVIVCPIGCLRP